MTQTDSIQQLIENKIKALGAEHINYIKNSSIDSISEIKIHEKVLGIIVYGLISSQVNLLIDLESTHCSQYFNLSFCYRKDSNLPINMNGLYPTTPAEKSCNSSLQVSTFLLGEFEDELQLTVSSDQRKLHLRIPLVPNSSSINHFQTAS